MAQNNTADLDVFCFNPSKFTSQFYWRQGALHAQDYTLPVFLLQLITVLTVSRALAYVLKYFRQPRVVAEILSGVILGPSLLGSVVGLRAYLFPSHSFNVTATVGNLAGVYFTFLVGLQMDSRALRGTARQIVCLAVAIVAFPLLLSVLAASAIGLKVPAAPHGGHGEPPSHSLFLLMIGVTCSYTTTSTLARILGELKLLNSEVGRLCLCASVLGGAIVTVSLGVVMSIHRSNFSPANGVVVDTTVKHLAGVVLRAAVGGGPHAPAPAAPLLTPRVHERFTAGGVVGLVVTTVAFAAMCLYVVRPAAAWLSRRAEDEKHVSDFKVCVMLMGVLVAAFSSDVIGVHPTFGAFVFGLVVPAGPLTDAVIDRTEEFVTGIMLPLYFCGGGFRTDWFYIVNGRVAVRFAFVIVLSNVAKVAAGWAVSQIFGLPHNRGIALGLLMTARGPMEIPILVLGKHLLVFDNQDIAVMMLTTVVVMMLVTPAVMTVHRTARRRVGYKRRNLQHARADAELRMVACVHTTRHVPPIISLVEASNPTKRSPIFIYALHLVELTGRASAMIVVHDTAQRSIGGRGAAFHSLPRGQAQSQSEIIISAFENYEQHAGGVSVQHLTAVAAHSNMPEDVCGIAEDRHANLLIIPFHRFQSVDGEMEELHPSLRAVNQGILANAPCSVGLLVDRGLSSAAKFASSSHRGVAHHVAVLFFGGRDDREALAYASRMAEHPGTALTVVRFLPGDDAARVSSSTTGEAMAVSEADLEGRLDDDYVNEFRLRFVSNESVVYTEKVASSSEETVAAIRAMGSIHNLYMVGRRQGAEVSLLMAGLTDWSEYPELGPIGDLLASADFGASVLVVQQYVEGGAVAEGGGNARMVAAEMALPAQPPPAAVTESSREPVMEYLSNANQKARWPGGWHSAA